LLNAANQFVQTFVVSRLRLDAALYEPAPTREAHQMGRPRLKGKRLPTLKDVFNDTQPVWQSLVVPQWSDLAIERTTPVLLRLFSVVTLMTHYHQTQHPMLIPQTAWYSKSLPTFSDAIAWVRRSLWSARLFSTSTSHKEMQKVPTDILHLWCDLLCHAA
jgi:hypothetical protein